MDKSQDALVLLRQIIRATDLHDKHISRSTGLTPPQLLTMQTLRSLAPLTSGALAKELGLAQATVTSILDRLENKGYVVRERGKEDKRKVWVELSESGTELLKGSPTTQQDIFIRQFEDMANWEQSMVISSLERVAHILNALHIDAAPVLDIGQLDRGLRTDVPAYLNQDQKQTNR
ncbi:MAG: MarR family winged helix-turn-helix transcriptional regulator [Pontibacterium sp.]